MRLELSLRFMVSMHGCAELANLDLVDIDTSAVESNIVLWHLKPEAPAVAVVLQRLKDAGFLVGGMKSAWLPLWSVLSVCTACGAGSVRVLAMGSAARGLLRSCPVGS